MYATWSVRSGWQRNVVSQVRFTMWGGMQIYSVQELIEIIRNRVSTDFQVEQDPALIRTGAGNRIVSDSAGHARLVEAPIRLGDPAIRRRSALCLIPIRP
jgi:hypothetical protein